MTSVRRDHSASVRVVERGRVLAVLAVVSRTLLADNVLLLVENGAFALFFGAVQTYAWLSA